MVNDTLSRLYVTECCKVVRVSPTDLPEFFKKVNSGKRKNAGLVHFWVYVYPTLGVRVVPYIMEIAWCNAN